MRIRKFQAATMREAIAQVKRELGSDAIIVSTREVRRGPFGLAGVEVTAAMDGDEAKAQAPAKAPPPKAQPAIQAKAPIARPLPPPVQPERAAQRVPTPQEIAAANRAPANRPGRLSAQAGGGLLAVETQGRSALLPPGLTEEDIEKIMAPLRAELRSIRAAIRPLTETRGQDDVIRGELHALRAAIAGIGQRPGSAGIGGAGGAPGAPLSDLEMAALTAPSSGRVVALVGPTGIGKTTTIAKLAARAALVFHRRVAIISLDSFRVGGQEQIQAFADLIGVPLKMVYDPERVPAVVAGLDHDLIFIDTAGRSPRDMEAITEVERALHAIPDVELHLCIAAGSPQALIDGWHSRYQNVVPNRLLFTKVDEAFDLSELVKAPLRLKCPIAHVTTGQRVPEDVEDAEPQRLVDLAMAGISASVVAA